MRVHIFFHAGAEQKRSANQRSLGQHRQGLQRLRYGTHHRPRQMVSSASNTPNGA